MTRRPGRQFGGAVIATLLAASAVTACSTKSNDSGPAPATGSPAETALGPGVSATSIRVGFTYPDLTALRKTLDVDAGNYEVAFRTVVNDINAHGGIAGRKIDPVFAPVNVIGTAPAAAACTKLTEDEHVFAVIGYFKPDDAGCYIKTHATPVVGVSLTAKEAQGAKAPWFNTLLSSDHLIPREMQAFKATGAFDGQRVAVIGASADVQTTQDIAAPELRKLGVNVVTTAIDSAPETDMTAVYQQFRLITDRLRSEKVDVVVAVGTASAIVPEALQANHSTYHPRILATDYLSLQAYTANKSQFDPAVVQGAMTASSEPPPSVYWNDPAMKACVAKIQAAEPAAKIGNPITSTSQTAQSWVAPQTACVQTTLFADIARRAGRVLNNDSFNRAGESLSSVTLPGSGGALHFSAGHHDGNGPVFVFAWDQKKKSLQTVEH